MTGESEFVEMTLMCCHSLYQPVKHVASADEYSGITASFSINTSRSRNDLALNETRWGCSHSTNTPTVWSCYFFLLTRAAVLPSVSGIDVSHRGLQGAGWRKGVRVRKYLWDVDTHNFHHSFTPSPGAPINTRGFYFNAGLQAILVGGARNGIQKLGRVKVKCKIRLSWYQILTTRLSKPK